MSVCDRMKMDIRPLEMLTYAWELDVGHRTLARGFNDKLKASKGYLKISGC